MNNLLMSLQNIIQINLIHIKKIMKYCLSQAFNPISFVSSSNDDAQEESTLVGLIWTTQILFVLLGLYIIFKMCQLCSKAFSYSNFHIHEAYKFYTLALISTIMIMASRAVQLQFAYKITYGMEHPDDVVPFRKDTYYEGWVIFNEIIGLMSVYTVNLMYALISITWLMVANKCDFNSRSETDRLDQEQIQKRMRDHTFYLRFRVLLLYILLPILMLLSVSGVLEFQSGWCLSSKIFLLLSNLLIYIVFMYSIINLFSQRFNDKSTPLKMKIMWGYLIVASTGRQIMSLLLEVQDFYLPFENQYVPIKGEKNSYNILIFMYSMTITTAPIFILSYLADKQLETEKTELERSERVIYTSTII